MGTDPRLSVIFIVETTFVTYFSLSNDPVGIWCPNDVVSTSFLSHEPAGDAFTNGLFLRKRNLLLGEHTLFIEKGGKIKMAELLPLKMYLIYFLHVNCTNYYNRTHNLNNDMKFILYV